jgi:hypothetical protein
MHYTQTLIPALCLCAGLISGQTPARPPAAPPPAAVPVAPLPPQPAFPADLDLRLRVELDQERALAAQEKAFAMQERAYGRTLTQFGAGLEDLETLNAKALASSDSLTYGLLFAPQQPSSPTFSTQRGRAFGTTLSGAQSEDRLYEAGQRALESRRWDEALDAFSQAAAKAGARADGAWFWKAYTLRKLARRDDALAAIAELRKTYPNSHWLNDAKALELEVRQASGQNVAPENESDEELKLMALNGLMRSDPDRAFPILENLLKSAQSPRLKRNAVFVLAQSSAPKAAQLLEQVARGGGNPDLQVAAIRYLGETRRQTNGGPQILSEIYAASNDVTVKRAVISSLGSSSDKDHLIQIVKTEKAPELRIEALRRLASNPAAQSELWQFYQSETSPEARRQILQNMPAANNTERLLEIARTDKDPQLRRFTVQLLGNQRAASDAMVSLYGSEQDGAVKRAIIDSLFAQRNAKALVQLARGERDFKMKQQLVDRLSGMKAPEATEYLMEILK